jgi:nucleoside-diphosphate-sugar epimerase
LAREIKKTIAITGVSGFVGKRLAEAAIQGGYQVIGFDTNPSYLQGMTFYQSNLLEVNVESLVPTNAVIIHLASLSTDPLCKDNPQLALDLNLKLTLRILQAAASSKAERFIFASSEWVYPEKQEHSMQYETDNLDLTSLNSLYAMTKLFGESLIRACAEIPFIILRFGIVYGPRKSPGSAAESIALKAAQGEEISVGASNTSRRFIYIDDLVEAILLSANVQLDTINGKIINIAGPEIISLSDIVNKVKLLSSSSPTLIDQGGKASIRNPDISTAKKLLGWFPAYSFEAGIEKCLSEMQGEMGSK